MGDVYMVNGKILSGLPNHAKDIEFDNDGTTLSSTNTEDAIKEINSNLPTLYVDEHTYYAIYRYGKLRVLRFSARTTNDGILTLLPAGDRPSVSISNTSKVIDGTTQYAGVIVVSTNGNVYGQYFLPGTTTSSDVNNTMQTSGEVIYFVS